MSIPPTPVLTADVYDLVDSTRKELNANIAALGDKFDQFATSNEHRLTVLETHQASQAQQLVDFAGALDTHSKDIGTIKERQQKDEAVTLALTDAKKSQEDAKTGRSMSKREWIGLACSLILAVVAIVALVH